MLERSFQDHRPDEDVGTFLTPAYFYDILKRRAFYFAIPFLLILAVGSLIVAAWPAIYLSHGTILVTAQEIPSNLVQPTVAALANDRIQIIEQRILTRDNLLAIAKKFRLSLGWQALASGTELVDFIKSRVEIAPADLCETEKTKGQQQYQACLAQQNQSGQKKNAVAFTVGFDYENPQTATLVANELVTMILSADVRLRTSDAAETTKFLAQEVNRLEGLLSSNDAQIFALKHSPNGARTSSVQLDEDEKVLTKLKEDLLIRSATFSATHPDIVALKRRIKAMEKAAVPNQASPTAAGSVTTNGPGLDTLLIQRDSIKDELNKATQKLSAARMGENMERGQHSERLEIIEQPTLPEKPVSPNKPKIFAFVFIGAMMVGGGLVFAAEMLNRSLRRTSDLYSLVDSHLVVAIPYISTHREVRHKKHKIIAVTGIVTTAVLAGLITLYFVLPPLDVLFDKAMGKLFQ